jgi:hypothetical protein
MRTAVQRLGRGAVAVLCLLALVLTTQPTPTLTSYDGSAARATAARAPSDNPLSGHPMGVYKGAMEQAWEPYVRAEGRKKRLLGKIALRPKAKWFGAWTGSPREIGDKVDAYIENSTGGDPDVLVQMTVFRMVPWEQEACDRLPTKKERRTYRNWIDEFAKATGPAHAAIILQPDGPFALCAPGGSRVPSRLIAYASRAFSALPHTSVYIDAGASDWPKDDPETAAEILVRAGVEHARGFVLDVTHYTSTGENIAHGTKVVAELARRGIPDRHFVVSTSENGRPFHFNDYRGSHPNNAKVCETKRERVCVTLGIPPTTRVASREWGLSRANRARARRHVDAYLWVGRPWLVMQTDPFSMDRALAMARTTPY